MIKRITSKDNPFFKEIRDIKKKGSKDFASEVFIEGEKILEEVCSAGKNIKTLILDEMGAEKHKAYAGISERVVVLPDNLFNKISYSKEHQGIAGVVELSAIGFNDRFGPDESAGMYLVSEDIRDPGNFGNIIRTAEAFGFSGVIYTKENADPFNEKVIRASMGSLFRIDLIYSQNLPDSLEFIKQKGFYIYGTHLEGESIEKADGFPEKCAIVFGNEGSGLSDETSRICHRLLKIPMKGGTQSLNVAGAAAIVCYIASRKKNL